MKLIDLHTHVLPGVDDGADTLKTALDMLRNADASHVAALAATPHCNVPGMPLQNLFDGNLVARLRALRQAAEAAGLPVKILSGMEVRVGENLKALLEQGALLGINGSRYLLTEFLPDTPPEAFPAALRTILDAGFVPLVAHPERYQAVGEAPQVVGQWLEMGCHVQLTGGSILGKFGKRPWFAAEYLLKNGMAAVAASDAHGLKFRTNNLLLVYDHLSTHYGPACARQLLFDNPYAICQNQIL